MYRHEIYLRRLQAELKSIMQTQDKGCLTASALNNPFYCPANILLGFAEKLAAELMSKNDKSIQDYVYLIVSLKITSKSYHPLLSEFKEAYPNTNYSESIDRLVQYFEAATKKS